MFFNPVTHNVKYCIRNDPLICNIVYANTLWKGGGGPPISSSSRGALLILPELRAALQSVKRCVNVCYSDARVKEQKDPLSAAFQRKLSDVSILL